MAGRNFVSAILQFLPAPPAALVIGPPHPQPAELRNGSRTGGSGVAHGIGPEVEMQVVAVVAVALGRQHDVEDAAGAAPDLAHEARAPPRPPPTLPHPAPPPAPR